MVLFDSYMAVDWSAANEPTTRSDSIWIAEGKDKIIDLPVNIRTRNEASRHIKAAILSTVSDNRRMLIGFDFAFGFPAGAAQNLTGKAEWQSLWGFLGQHINDSSNNESNRLALAGHMNSLMGHQEGPFWGYHHAHEGRYPGLRRTAPKFTFETFALKRHVEKLTPGAKSVWQLFCNGAVGSQTLLGIAALERLRQDPELKPHIAVWPFETNFAGNINKPIILAEIYPSSHENLMKHKTKDAAQVMTVVRDFMHWDAVGQLGQKLTPQTIDPASRAKVLTEEGWIIGR